MRRSAKDLETLGRAFDVLQPMRSRLLTSLENERVVIECIEAVRSRLALEDLALYLVHPETQQLEIASRSGVYRFQQRHRASLELTASVAGKAVLAARTVLEPYAAGRVDGVAGSPRLEVAVPVRIAEDVVGVLDSLVSDQTRLAEYHLTALELFAADLGLALSNLRTVKRLRERLSTDDLTGLHNERHFLERLEIELKRANRNGAPLGILLFSIDRMAEIRQQGYAPWERAVQQVAQILKRNSRATDVLARLGDTEFTLTLGGCDMERSLMVADKFCRLVGEPPHDSGEAVTVSVGTAVYPVHATEKEELLFLARQAACLARFGGGNQVCTIGSDAMKTMALKAFSAMLNPERLQTGPQTATQVTAHLKQLADDPIFSPVVQQIVESLASAIDAKDRYTKDHSEVATRYAEGLGRACRLSAKQLELVKMAAKLHDLGKIGIPEQILRKPGPLTEEEWQIMREHPTLGANILKPIESLAELVPIVQCHHERWNGSGYPTGLQGTQIPLEARLIAVIDSFHAIVSERPYKKAMPV
ncbi:MAG: HD domain-containing phosphohydrolase, partial [Acidobacteriota bacterium]